MFRSFYIFLLASVISISGCASVLDDASQEITFLTPGAEGAICYVHNGAVKYRVFPPETILITKKPDVMRIHCEAPGNRERTIYIEPEPQGIGLTNALNGFVGVYVDHETGALYMYPHVIEIDFRAVETSLQPLPDYQRLLLENPELADMEEFRTGLPALQSDKYVRPNVMQKREFGADDLKSGLIAPESVTVIEETVTIEETEMK